MSYTYNSQTRILLVSKGARIKTYRNVNLLGIEQCIQDFVDSWGK